MARRGIGGMNGRLSAWVSTGAGKISGSALRRRASAIRLRSARHSDVFFIARPGFAGTCHEDGKDFVSCDYRTVRLSVGERIEAWHRKAVLKGPRQDNCQASLLAHGSTD